MEKIGYIGDKPEKTWPSPITRKKYEFTLKGKAKCPTADVEDPRDVTKLLSHSSTFDLYSRIKDDDEYFVKLESRRKAKKAAQAKAEKDDKNAQKIAAVGEVEGMIGEMIKPLVNAINNLEDLFKGLRMEVDELNAAKTPINKSGAETPK